MAQEVTWKLVVDETGAIKRIEEFGKAGEKADKVMEKTKKSAEDASGGVKGLGGAFSGLKSMAGMALGALGGIGIGYGLESLASKTSEVAEETERFQSASGMHAQTSLYYVAALKARGIGTQALARGYNAFAKSLQTAERQEYTYSIAQDKAHAKGRLFMGLLGVQAEAFQRLGVSYNALKSMSPEKQFQAITEKFEAMPASAEKTRLATQLFARSGLQLLPVLQKGSLSLNHNRLEAEKYFPVLKGGSHVLDELQEKQAESKLAWEGLEFTIGMKAAPAISTALGWFAKLIGEMDKGKGPLGEVAHVFDEIGTFAGHAFSFIKEISGALGVKLSGETLGGVLAAAAAYKGITAAAKPVKTAASVATTVKKYGPYLTNPYVDVGVGAAFGGYLAGKTVYGGSDLEGFTPGNPYGQAPTQAPRLSPAEQHEKALNIAELQKDAREAEQAFRLQSKPTSIHEEHLRELTAIRNEIMALRHQGQSGQHIIGELHMDSTKFGEVIALNPRAMRFLAEGVERAGLGRNARR